jgi:hypothetical protein
MSRIMRTGRHARRARRGEVAMRIAKIAIGGLQLADDVCPIPTLAGSGIVIGLRSLGIMKMLP